MYENETNKHGKQCTRLNMKKQLLTFGVILLLMFGAVAAQTQTTKQTAKDPGITPDSFWWKLDVLFDNIEEMISFSEKAKVESRLEHAQERLAELQAMAAEQKIDAMAKAEQEHGKHSTKAEQDCFNHN